MLKSYYFLFVLVKNKIITLINDVVYIILERCLGEAKILALKRENPRKLG